MVMLPSGVFGSRRANIAAGQDSQLPRGLADIHSVPQESSDFLGWPNMPDDRTPATPGPLNPNALSVEDASRLLTRAGGWLVTEKMIEEDLDSGAPENADGTINLVHYAAWLVKGMSSGDRSAATATG
jgi:hypothetical protein